MINTRLFLDDIRTPNSIFRDTYNPDWDIAKNYTEFVNALTRLGRDEMYEIISLDHDIDEEQYGPPSGGYNSPYKEATGADCAYWLGQYMIAQNKFPKQIFVHTMNPAGGDNIVAILEQVQRVAGKQFSIHRI